MKNAREIAMMTKEACDKMLIKRHEDTMLCINNMMFPEIEKQAKAGEASAKFRTGESFDRDLIRKEFEALGYEVTIKGYEVSISWLSAFVRL